MQVRTILLAGMCALLPAAVHAQDRADQDVVRIISRASSGWLGFAYGGGERGAVVVDTVIPDSPAARAGMQKSDTITAVNGLRATPQLLRSLGLEPGDEVEVTVRRAGHDRTLELVAAERPEGYASNDGWGIAVNPGRILDAVRMQLDSIDFPDVFVQTLPDSGGRMMMIRRHGSEVDTVRFDFDADSLRRNFHFFSDSMRVAGDSTFHRAFRFFDDSMRTAMDSVFIRLGRPGMRFQFFGDSVMVLGGDTIDLPRVRMFSNRDGWSNVPRIAGVGFRSVAGMQLEELSERLGEYFGADRGLLILEVADDTPAARAGLQDGDVILEADGEEVRTVQELRRILARNRGEDVRVQILRERQELTRTLQLDGGTRGRSSTESR